MTTDGDTIALSEALPLIRDTVHRCAPRLFTIYGADEVTGSPLIGWGMDFGPKIGALYWQPHDNTTHTGESAEQIHKIYELAGVAHLDWL
ncbi:hypothetical protein EV193_103691 [Herbihabitans rhizosphaerae]|uniref:Uncharacterized protein n=1 Tax=Herbihabitans rhizosphaerae TaxID=1872711 RepID=A0A4Q7KWC6_9PSEU|nr:hypothetical protein [Herbihabitans rhizosphaerae]RZS41368.1 hypothetical protein EV193_103691 [Herbihabitans rhizosphaerae]